MVVLFFTGGKLAGESWIFKRKRSLIEKQEKEGSPQLVDQFGWKAPTLRSTYVDTLSSLAVGCGLEGVLT